jgi:large subunit ribosomal protein L18
MSNKKIAARQKRKAHIRRSLVGDAERPRLTVFRSVKHITAQVIDDSQGRTLVAASSLEKEVRDAGAELKKSDIAKKVGELLAKRCLEKEIKKVKFDRNGFIYHGRVAKVAEGARAAGLEF